VADAQRRQGSFACPRCKKTLREVTRVPPLQNEDGLIAYECSACGYVTSVILPAGMQTNDDVP
jgi:transcription elongation factor Elf1